MGNEQDRISLMNEFDGSESEYLYVVWYLWGVRFFYWKKIQTDHDMMNKLKGNKKLLKIY